MRWEELKGPLLKIDPLMQGKTLREVLKPIYEKLRDKGVNDADLPNNEDLVDRLLGFIGRKPLTNGLTSMLPGSKESPKKASILKPIRLAAF